MLIEDVSPFAASMKELRELFEAEQPELDLIEARLEDIIKQFYVKTATWSIGRWENDFLIEHDSTLSIEQRRAMLLAKINSRTTATIAMLENMVKQIMDAKQVVITENTADYSFTIYVNTAFLVHNFNVADVAVYLARPAHLNYKFINELIRKLDAEFRYGVSLYNKKTFWMEVE